MLLSLFLSEDTSEVLEHDLLGDSVGHELEEEKREDSASVRSCWLVPGVQTEGVERRWAQQADWAGLEKRIVTWSPLVGMIGEWRPLGKEVKSGFVGLGCNGSVHPFPNGAEQTACCRGCTYDAQDL